MAQRLVMAGQILVDGQTVFKSSRQVSTGAKIEIRRKSRFVSRGGEKLAAAFMTFPISVENLICADVGASTGGFTDCLLQNGARRVYAIDVGHGILHWRLRNNPRVIVMERTNARNLESLPEPIDFATMDASFISVRLLLPRMIDWLRPHGELIVLIKPQFEAGRELVGKGGVVRDPAVHRSVLEGILVFIAQVGLGALGLIPSPLRGPKGNIEFLIWCRKGVEPAIGEGRLSELFPD